MPRAVAILVTLVGTATMVLLSANTALSQAVSVQPALTVAPAPAAYPQPAVQAPPIAATGTPVAAHPFRQLFAGTIAALVSATGAAVVGSVAQGVNGAITGWFARKSGQSAPAVYPGTTQPYVAAAPGYPQPSAPVDAGVVSYPVIVSPAPSPAYVAQTADVGASAVAGGGLYAGIAYEVQAIGSNGLATTVNVAEHIFFSGDRFVIAYRPSMPGHMEVFNVNPAGQQSRIDAVDMAAGQLATLGPYQFSSTTGDESLRLVLTPCSTPQLLATTRDIINVAATAGAATAQQLGNCGEVRTRGLSVRARDISKVVIEGSTSFALDPVAPQELTAGQLAAREVNIVFHHR